MPQYVGSGSKKGRTSSFEWARPRWSFAVGPQNERNMRQAGLSFRIALGGHMRVVVEPRSHLQIARTCRNAPAGRCRKGQLVTHDLGQRCFGKEGHEYMGFGVGDYIDGHHLFFSFANGIASQVAKIQVEKTMTIPSGTELVRPFVPARDFELSKRFYEEIGFEKLLDGEVAIFGIGSTGFILQNRFEKEWAENFMMQLMVDDLDSWWSHIERLGLPMRFGVVRPRPPALQPWGLRVAFLVDPSGVLWHVTQRRGGNLSDSGRTGFSDHD